MGADIKNLRIRIRSVDSTLHLTSAMGLVASSKIRRAMLAMGDGRAYADAVKSIAENLTISPECRKSPYMKQNNTGKTKIIVIAGDRGMCGGYNANVFRLAREFSDAEFIPIGKRACDRFGEGFASSERFSRMDGFKLAEKLCAEFTEGKYDRLGIISTKYVSMMTQTADIQWILPLTKSDNAKRSSILFEPDEMTVLESIVSEYVSGLIMAAVRESFACEVSARRMAMDSAGKNAKKMIYDLTLQYNRARQSTITQEITEIVAGSGQSGGI